MRTLFLFFKAGQFGLFDAPVNVQGHTTSRGTFVAPYSATRKKRMPSPTGGSGDLFAEPAGATAPREPHEIRRQDYVNAELKKPGQSPKYRGYHEQQHERHVQRALEQGKTVPQEVLRDYPHVVAQVRKQRAFDALEREQAKPTKEKKQNPSDNDLLGDKPRTPWSEDDFTPKSKFKPWETLNKDQYVKQFPESKRVDASGHYDLMLNAGIRGGAISYREAQTLGAGKSAVYAEQDRLKDQAHTIPMKDYLGQQKQLGNSGGVAYDEKWHKDYHKNAVMGALKWGKNKKKVPAEVLKDYPEFHAKATADIKKMSSQELNHHADAGWITDDEWANEIVRREKESKAEAKPEPKVESKAEAKPEPKGDEKGERSKYPDWADDVMVVKQFDEEASRTFNDKVRKGKKDQIFLRVNRSAYPNTPDSYTAFVVAGDGMSDMIRLGKDLKGFDKDKILAEAYKKQNEREESRKRMSEYAHDRMEKELASKLESIKERGITPGVRWEKPSGYINTKKGRQQYDWGVVKHVDGKKGVVTIELHRRGNKPQIVMAAGDSFFFDDFPKPEDRLHLHADKFKKPSGKESDTGDFALKSHRPRILFFKAATYSMPHAEAVEEHRRLVRVLRSPRHEDDLAEAKEQAGELREIEGKAKRKKKKAGDRQTCGVV